MRRRLTVRAESWPLLRPFTIARGSKRSAEVIVAEVEEDGLIGRGEGVPYPRYGESSSAAIAKLEALSEAVGTGLDRTGLKALLPAGAARNALDCALWDLEAKQTGRPVWALAGLSQPCPVTTAETIVLDSPEAMAAAARAMADRPVLKVKVGRECVVERVKGVRAAAPRSRLIIDANEGWDRALLDQVCAPLADLGVALIEQPLPATADCELATYNGKIPLAADESIHTTSDLDRLVDAYRVVNVKLDKAGGLTEALLLSAAVRARCLGLMVGCMVCTSLGVAPALLVAADADWVDLDGPVWLAADRPSRLSYAGGSVGPAEPALWG